MMKRIFTAIVAIAALLLVVMFALSIKMNADLKMLVFADTDINLVEDGLYLGRADTDFVKAEVEVTVRDHRIISISILKHDQGFGEKAEVIVEEMIRMNTCEVDTVSGATASSKVIQCAVSDALSKGRIEGKNNP
jgi:uncharacterized protein with FMN-binding domain